MGVLKKFEQRLEGLVNGTFAKVFKSEVLVPVLNNNNSLIRRLSTEESFSNIRSAPNRIKAVRCMADAGAAEKRNGYGEDRQSTFGCHGRHVYRAADFAYLDRFLPTLSAKICAIGGQSCLVRRPGHHARSRYATALGARGPDGLGGLLRVSARFPLADRCNRLILVTRR